MDTLLETDWGKAWIERNKLRPQAGDSTCWDERSQDFKNHSGVSCYTDIFLEYLALSPGESVFDMGSGPGTIAIPLAKAGHSVIAADFSSGMREAALQRIAEENIQTMEVIGLDWNEDWDKRGIEHKSVDVAIASRSTSVEDLEAALLKMDRLARNKVAVTMATEYSPRGYKPRGSKQRESDEHLGDYIYGINILFQMGAYPDLRYIDTIHGNGGDMEQKLVRWAFISWKPITTE